MPPCGDLPEQADDFRQAARMRMPVSGCSKRINSGGDGWKVKPMKKRRSLTPDEASCEGKRNPFSITRSSRRCEGCGVAISISWRPGTWLGTFRPGRKNGAIGEIDNPAGPVVPARDVSAALLHPGHHSHRKSCPRQRPEADRTGLE